jgi:glycosyltransferase involved in cell wall biosynthesis
MRVLLINFEMDKSSPVLAWQSRVAKELSNNCTSIHMLTEKMGDYDLTPNMTVDVIPRRPFSIPKALGGGILVNLQLYRLLKKHPCDVCFIHMAHKWAYRLWPVLKLNRLPILIWYAHGSVSWHLKLATLCADKLVTSTEEGLRLNTPKKIVIGQAIDTDFFTQPADRNPKPEIVYVGRISKRKRIELLIDTLKALRDIDSSTEWTLKIAGPTLTNEDREYLGSIQKYIGTLSLENCIKFTGALTQAETIELYKTASVHLNVSNTGSMDKTVMEALSCGCPVVTTNEAFKDALSNITGAYSDSSDPISLAKTIYQMAQKPPPQAELRSAIEGKHDLKSWLNKLNAILLKLIAGKEVN